MANMHGDFIWYELLTPDPGAAQDFYRRVLGWTFVDSGMAGMTYDIVHMGSEAVGGMMALDAQVADAGGRPGWLGYVQVDDVDRCVESIVHGGGTVCMPAMDVPTVGRIAMVTDPQGAAFYVMKPADADGTSLAFAYDRPRDGHCAWNELTTSDQDAAWRFYGTRFGWTKQGELAMGEGMGSYDFVHHNSPTGGMIGAIMGGSPAYGPPHWTQYFRVPDIDDAKATIEAAGGAILNGPMEIPGGEYALNATDPQGVAFGLVGARR